MAGMPETTVELEKERVKPRGGAITHLAVDGMTCGNCARHVTEALQKVSGVRSATVSLDAHQATVRWAADAPAQPAALIDAVREEGFSAQPLEERAHANTTHRGSGWGVNLWLGLPVTGLLMLGEWALRLGDLQWFRWLSFGLAALVQVFAGARFYRGAWNQLKVGNSNMDALVALGSSTAFIYSTWALLQGHGVHLYFMEAAAIISLISAGHWMEARVSRRASSALRQLLNLAPEVAIREDTDGSQREVPIGDIRENDRIVLRPGSRVPTDAVVLEGTAAVDEAMLTGESVPADKTPGSEIYAGTINLNGQLKARVTATGEQTALSQIVAAVQRAQSSRAGIQRLGDKVSSVFVPVVVAIALAAALWWGLAPQWAMKVNHWLGGFLWHVQAPEGGMASAFIIASSVLIIACPCAMGLATPAAIMAGSNAAAQRGILIRDGIALEKAGHVTVVVFDKTGTLTAGKPELASFVPLNTSIGNNHPSEEADLLAKRLAAGLARSSNHPVSRAITALCADELHLTDVKEIHGGGVSAIALQMGGERAEARLGSLRWLAEEGVDVSTGAAFVNQWSAKGATTVGVSLGHALVGMVAVQDALKPGAANAVDQIKRSGLKCYLITGDNSLTAGNIAKQVGIAESNVFAEVRPEQKAQLVKRFQEQGEHVAFVGDGINDAPALEQADLGIAVSRASDIAREAADIILLKSDIEAIPESLGLARATLRTIHQNLFWAFFYNALGIPLAALGLMSPILCAAAMGLSDLVVIGNALRLRRWRL